jgi:hypothetical protein
MAIGGDGLKGLAIGGPGAIQRRKSRGMREAGEGGGEGAGRRSDDDDDDDDAAGPPLAESPGSRGPPQPAPTLRNSRWAAAAARPSGGIDVTADRRAMGGDIPGVSRAESVGAVRVQVGSTFAARPHGCFWSRGDGHEHVGR